ncbi:phosphate ABC transporter permease subunit PstC [Paenalcaligenes sp. Me131]|uniref:phosphate ABC transporter permease subunit PstC n=1 Tax=Paenalcaligenes sp. Me131 TaxID=3392636 RepID=UPI003D2E16A4
MKQTQNSFLDAIFKNLTRSFAFLVFILLAGIMVSLIYGSRESIAEYGLSFLWTNEWDPVRNEYGALVPILGTLATSFIALLIAVPVSFGIAMFLTELSPVWLRRPLGTAIEMLAAIPSIIYGMWGLFVFVPLFQEYVQPSLISLFEGVPVLGTIFAGPPFGIGVFTAGLILSIMIIPFITAVMRDVFELVPSLLKESAYGLGSTTWEVTWKVVLPFTRNGVIGGVMLGLGRALGETMAVTFVIGNAFNLPNSIFAPSNSIASALANEFNEAGGMQKSALLELGLILFLITTVVLALSKMMLLRLSKSEGSKT